MHAARQPNGAGLVLGDLVIPGALPLGTIVTEAGDGEDDQSRVEQFQALRRQAEAVHHAGPEVFR